MAKRPGRPSRSSSSRSSGDGANSSGRRLPKVPRPIVKGEDGQPVEKSGGSSRRGGRKAKKKNNSGAAFAIIVVVVVLILGGGAAGFVMLTGGDEDPTPVEGGSQAGTEHDDGVTDRNPLGMTWDPMEVRGHTIAQFTKQDEIRKLLGEPLSKSTYDGIDKWQYAIPGATLKVDPFGANTSGVFEMQFNEQKEVFIIFKH